MPPSKPLPVTLEITRNTSRVIVRGRRSTKGWTVARVDGCRCDPMGTRKSKDDALQLALDCCEPNLSATFRVSPIS